MAQVEEPMDFDFDDIELDFDLDNVILHDPVKELLEQILSKLNEIQVRIDSIESRITNN